MTFEVRVRSVDRESPYSYPSRRVEITTGSGRAATPCRAATLYEYNKKSSVPTNIPLDNDVSLAVKGPNAAAIGKFLEDNGAASRWGREMRSAANRMAYSALRAYLVQPTATDVPAPRKNGRRPTTPAAPSGVRYLASSPEKLERFLRILIRLQAESGLDVVAVPYIELPLSEYKRMARSAYRSVVAAGAEPMFALDLNYQRRGDRFGEALSFLARDLGARLVALPGRSYASAPVSYDALAGYAETDVAFVSFNTDRNYQGPHRLSKMHSLPFVGTDIYAVRAPRFVPGAAGGQGAAAAGAAEAGPTLDSVRFFDPSTLTVRPSGERVGDPDSLLGEIGERGNGRLRGILEEYGSMRGDPDKIAVLSSVSKVHELKSSTAEFGGLQGWIDRGETAEYLVQKPQLGSTLEDLKIGRRGR